MLDILLAAAVMGPWSMSDGCVHRHCLPMYRPQYRIVTPWEVQGMLILAARRDRAAWIERRAEKAEQARSVREAKRYNTYARLAARPRKTLAEVQAIAEEAWRRRMRARARADRARAQGYGHANQLERRRGQ